jgi:uncharacterized membrane protein (Fun14 family)
MFESLAGLVSQADQVLKDLGLEKTLQGFGTNTHDAAFALVLGGVGFLGGFFARKYFRFMFLSTIVLAIGIKMLEHKGMISVDWRSLYAVAGVNSTWPITSLQVFFDTFLEWMKQHMIPSLGLMFGFYSGLRAG